MYKYLTLLLILCVYQVRSQTDFIEQNTELNIQTKFIQYGGLLETSSRNSPMIAQFNKGQKCLVKSFLGNATFKIEYKRWVGYVTSENIYINDELEEVIKKYKENKDYNRENVNNLIVEESPINIETRAKVDEAVQLKQLAEANAKYLAEKEKAKADEALRLKQLTEDQTKTDEAERIRLTVEAKAKADEDKKIRVAAQVKAKENEEERIGLAAEAVDAQTEKVKTEDKINEQGNNINQTYNNFQNTELNIRTKFKQYGSLFETLSINSSVMAPFNKGQKCVVKNYLGNSTFKIEYKKWVGYVTSDDLVINDELEAVIKKPKEPQTMRIQKVDAEVVQEELSIVETEKKNEVVEPMKMELKQESNSVKNQKEDKIIEQRVDIDRIELRFTCHYQMNEIDEFYNERIIKTENYEVNSHLKIELYRIGNKKHVFMNFDGQLGCASYFSHNRSYAKIKLENNTIVTIYHSWNVDCANFSLKGILSNSSKSKLKESPIKSIKLQGTKDFIEIENIVYKEFFMDKLGCLD